MIECSIVNPRSGRKPLEPFAKAYPCPLLEDLIFEMRKKWAVRASQEGFKLYAVSNGKIKNTQVIFTAHKFGDCVAKSIILDQKIITN